MPRFSTENREALASAMTDYLNDFPGETICALQIWYECLGAYGVPTPSDMEAMHDVLDGVGGWRHAGDERFEKFGVQRTYRRTADRQPKAAAGKIMSHHMFKVGGLYKDPAGRVFKVALSEVYNIRCFEIMDGNMVGPMVKIHPTSELAKSLLEVTG